MVPKLQQSRLFKGETRMNDIEDRIHWLYRGIANFSDVANILYALLERIKELERKLREKT